jgi:DNA-binding NtrC family response regulator
LREQRWNVGKTAAALNVSRTSLYALMNRCPRVRKAGDLSREEIADALSRCQGALPAMVDLLEVSRRGLQLRMTDLGLAAVGDC